MQKGGQALSERVDEQMCHVLRAGTQLEDGQKLGAGINRQPEPLHLRMAAQPGSQFIQLEVRQVQMGEEALMQPLSMRARASQPRRDGGLAVAEDPFGSGSIQSFGQREIRTIATCWEGVFRRYMGVSRRALNVVRQA